MLWNVPEVPERRTSGSPQRRLAVAGTIERGQRTVLTLLPISAVRPNPEQPRKHFDDDKLAELAASIRDHGLLQPIVVRRTDDGFELLAGERRFRAAQRAGVDRLPALVRDGDDPLEIALIENLQRENLSPLEEAEALDALVERHGYSHQVIADLLGKSRPYVSNTLALTRLPQAVKEEIHRGTTAVPREMLMGIAREPDEEHALALWRRLRLDTLSVRQFRAVREGADSEPAALHELLLAARRLNRALRRALANPQQADEEAPKLARTLRRTRRLVDRQLAALANAS